MKNVKKKKPHQKDLPNRHDKLQRGNEGRRQAEIQQELGEAKVINGVHYIKSYV